MLIEGLHAGPELLLVTILAELVPVASLTQVELRPAADSQAAGQ